MTIQAGYKQGLLLPSCSGENIQPQNKRVSIPITGPRLPSPWRHLIAVALTCQSPAANAM